MDNPESLATLDTQDRGQRQTKHTTQNTKMMSNMDITKKKHKKTGVNTGAREG